MDSTHTDNAGKFKLFGETREVRNIEPYLLIKHNCDNGRHDVVSRCSPKQMYFKINMLVNIKEIQLSVYWFYTLFHVLLDILIDFLKTVEIKTLRVYLTFVLLQRCTYTDRFDVPKSYQGMTYNLGKVDLKDATVKRKTKCY